MVMDICIELWGLAILDTILSWTIPKLGASVDVTSTVELLIILPNDILSSFLVRCSEYNRAVRDAGVTINPNQLIWRMIKVLNNCPPVEPYIMSKIAGFCSHIQQHPNTEYQSYPVTFMIDQLRTSGIYMNMWIIIPSNRFTNSSGRRPRTEINRITNNDGRRFDQQNKSHDRLENGDRRRVSFGAPRTATMNVNDYDHEDEIDLIEKLFSF